MTGKNLSKRLQKSIVGYSAMGILVIGVIVALVSIGPLYKYLKENADRNLQLVQNTKTRAVEEYLSRAKDIASQISSRTRIREVLEVYNRGEITLKELVKFTENKLLDAMNHSEEVAGISRLDKGGNLVVYVGKPIPKKFWSIPDTKSIKTNVSGSVNVEGEEYIVVVSKILNKKVERVGTDIVLFKLERLQHIIQDYTGLGEYGETVLAAISGDNKILSLFPLRRGDELIKEISISSPIGIALEKAAFHQEKGILQPGEQYDSPEVLAFGPIKGSKWAIVVQMNEDELYAPVMGQMVPIGSIILVLILLGVFGMGMLMRPLTGRMVNLEQDLENKSIDLQKELKERKQAQEHIKHLQSALMSIRKINQLIVQEKNKEKLLQTACDILKETSDYKLVWFGMIDGDNKNILPVGQAGFENGYLKSLNITLDDSGTDSDPTKAALKTGKPFIMKNISTDSRYELWKKEAIKRGYSSMVSIPLTYGERSFGVLNVYASIPDAFDLEEMDLLLEVSQDIAFAMNNIDIEREIETTKELLQNVIDKTSDLVCTIDMEGKFLSINKAVTEKLGYEKEELIGKPKIDFAVDRELFSRKFKEVLENGSISNWEVPLKRKDGSIAFILYSITLLKDRNGKPVAMAGFGKDVTENKENEKRIRRNIKELTTIYDAARKLQYLHTPDTLAQELIAILEKNLSFEYGVVLLIDEATSRLIPFAVSDQGRGEEFIKADKEFILSKGLTVGKGITGWVAETGQTVRLGDVRYDPRYYTLRGEDIRSELCVPLKAGNRVIGVLNVETNKPDAYTESDQRVLETIASQMALAIQQSYLHEQIQHHTTELEERVHERTTQLQFANKELEAFAYSVSHDLRAPLRSIHGFTEILLEDYTDKLDDEGKRICAVIKKNAERMSQLIDDLLTFSRLSRKELNKTVIDMNRLVKSVCLEVIPPDKSNKVKIIIDDLCDAFGDPNLIKQVWFNLISNAVKFSAKKKMPEINISFEKENNMIIYSVKDNGAGFDMRYLNKLFGVFQRLHSEKEFSGTGVGLAIVQRIIQRHGGEVWAEGKVDEGAAFYFSIPDKEEE